MVKAFRCKLFRILTASRLYVGGHISSPETQNVAPSVSPAAAEKPPTMRAATIEFQFVEGTRACHIVVAKRTREGLLRGRKGGDRSTLTKGSR